MTIETKPDPELFATVSWRATDLMDEYLLTEAEATEFLRNNAEEIVVAMNNAGFAAIDTLITRERLNRAKSET